MYIYINISACMYTYIYIKLCIHRADFLLMYNYKVFPQGNRNIQGTVDLCKY